MDGSACTSPGDRVSFIASALARLEAGRGSGEDVAALLCADPAELSDVVARWPDGGVVARFRHVSGPGSSPEQCEGFLAGEQAWVATLFLVLGGSVGQDVVAAATRVVWRAPETGTGLGSPGAPARSHPGAGTGTAPRARRQWWVTRRR